MAHAGSAFVELLEQLRINDVHDLLQFVQKLAATFSVQDLAAAIAAGVAGATNGVLPTSRWVIARLRQAG